MAPGAIGLEPSTLKFGVLNVLPLCHSHSDLFESTSPKVNQENYLKVEKRKLKRNFLSHWRQKILNENVSYNKYLGRYKKSATNPNK